MSEQTPAPQAQAPQAQAPQAQTPKPRAKRDPEGRRRAIVQAATEIIVAHGSGALTHRAVAAKAGVALGSTTQYFASIDDLREAAFLQLATEMHESLVHIEPFVKDIMTDPSQAVTPVLEYLADPRAAYADIALFAAGAVDPRLRDLSRQWTARLIDMLEPHVGRANARAIAIYLDGATVHAVLHDEPLTREEITRVFVALSGSPAEPGNPSTH